MKAPKSVPENNGVLNKFFMRGKRIRVFFFSETPFRFRPFGFPEEYVGLQDTGPSIEGGRKKVPERGNSISTSTKTTIVER